MNFMRPGSLAVNSPVEAIRSRSFSDAAFTLRGTVGQGVDPQIRKQVFNAIGRSRDHRAQAFLWKMC